MTTASSTKENQKKNSQTNIVVLKKAFKLAEQWVNNMSESSVNVASALEELEGRPSRLGIGAVVPKESKVMHSNSSIERTLFSKLRAVKRKTMEKDVNVEGDDEEEELDSRTKAFSKKGQREMGINPTKRKLR